MKKKQLLTFLAAVLILALGAGIGYAASNYGTQEDPLVAKSYLDQVLTPKLQSDFQARLDREFAAVDSKISNAADSARGNFSPVSLSEGQTLTVTAGSEIILRSGSASALGSLTDVTAGQALAEGAGLEANHLCVASSGSSGLAASGETTLLVRGPYSVA